MGRRIGGRGLDDDSGRIDGDAVRRYLSGEAYRALERRLAVARGDEPADLVVRGGQVFSVFTRERIDADVAVCDGAVAGLGPYEGEEVLDASGTHVVPGFVDAHMHFSDRGLVDVDRFELVPLRA